LRISTATAAAPTRPAIAAGRYFDLVPTPLGVVAVAVDGSGRLVEIRLDGARPEGVRDMHSCAAARQQLEEYFAGTRRVFTLELLPHGTAFQQRVWRALQAIPFGTLRNYGDIARAIGQPNATRAVGQANGRNPLPIVVPCHRVIASDGTIGGYTGGLGIKHRLLALEGIELDL
jgi:methylated-DNA-[protein]-cysteine S-methyltransferase